MKPGTPGFIGDRLRQAREARGLTALSLADLIGKSPAAIYQYENGDHSPHPDVMGKISNVLHLSEGFFRRPIYRKNPRTIFYRSMAAATKGARNRVEKRYEWLQEIVAYLLNFVQLPIVNIPNFNVPNDPLRLSTEEIEEFAVATREFWKLGQGPIGNLVQLLENNGVIVAREELGADTLDAFSEYCLEDGLPYIFLSADKAIGCRSRFDAAHELGHLILHQKINKSAISRPVDFQVLEKQANRFAGAFLLPTESFAAEFYSSTLDALKIIKGKWRVSIAMALYRAEELGFIPTEQAKKLWITYSRRRWKKEEPLDDQIKIETPCLISLGIQLLINDRIQTREQILSALELPAHDIESLAGLPSGYLSQPSSAQLPPIKVLPTYSIPAGQGLSKNPGQIVQFPHNHRQK